MSRPRRIEVDRIVLTLHGLPVAQAELVAARLQAAMAATAFAQQAPSRQEAPSPSGGGLGWGPAGGDEAPGDEPPSPPSPSGGRSETLRTALTGPALVDAIAARLLTLLGLPPEDRPWP